MVLEDMSRSYGSRQSQLKSPSVDYGAKVLHTPPDMPNNDNFCLAYRIIRVDDGLYHTEINVEY